MRVNQETIGQYLEIVERKKELWSSILPQLHFDRFGRAKIKEQGERRYDIAKYYGKEVVETQGIPLSQTFKEAFNRYLNEMSLALVNGENVLSTIESGKDIPVEGLIVNRFNLFDGRKTIEMKASKVLAKVQEIWTSMNPKYDQTLKKIREVPVSERNGGNYISLLLSKTLYEKGNLYVDYQKIMNDQSHRELYITINPLDFLTCSGGSNGSPTKFNTCLSLSVHKSETDVLFEEDGCYSSAEALLLLGSIPNVGMVYQKNGNFIEVPNTDFSFIGYTMRGRCWLDERGLWIENFYPYSVGYDKLISLGLPIIREGHMVVFEDKHDFSHYINIEDKESVKNFARYCLTHSDSIYLDRVGISRDGGVYMLPELRKEYDDAGDGFQSPYDEYYEREVEHYSTVDSSQRDNHNETPSPNPQNPTHPSISVFLSQRLEDILRRRFANTNTTTSSS